MTPAFNTITAWQAEKCNVKIFHHRGTEGTEKEEKNLLIV